MEQPILTIEPFEHADALLEILGVKSELPVELYDNGSRTPSSRSAPTKR
jgi:hypothetical protein